MISLISDGCREQKNGIQKSANRTRKKMIHTKNFYIVVFVFILNDGNLALCCVVDDDDDSAIEHWVEGGTLAFSVLEGFFNVNIWGHLWIIKWKIYGMTVWLVTTPEYKIFFGFSVEILWAFAVVMIAYREVYLMKIRKRDTSKQLNSGIKKFILTF